MQSWQILVFDGKELEGGKTIADYNIITTGNSGFPVRHGRTAKALKRTANSLSCVFRRGTLQRAHGSILHGKALCRAPRLTTHGK
jgi:hypothetical protein